MTKTYRAVESEVALTALLPGPDGLDTLPELRVRVQLPSFIDQRVPRLN
jgi:hypothetical protein